MILASTLSSKQLPQIAGVCGPVSGAFNSTPNSCFEPKTSWNACTAKQNLYRSNTKGTEDTSTLHYYHCTITYVTAYESLCLALHARYMKQSLGTLFSTKLLQRIAAAVIFIVS